MPNDALQCTVNIDAGPDSDERERADLARRLLGEILTLSEVERAEPATVAAPPGGKTPFVVDPHTLIVTLAASGGVLTTLIGLIQAFVTRPRHEKPGVTITVKIGGDECTITGASPEAERRLLHDWIGRHGS